MNQIVLLSMVTAFMMLIGSILYFTPYFSKKKIRHGRFDLLQFIFMFFSPLLLVPLFYFFRELLNLNPMHRIVFIPKYISEIIFMLTFYLLVLGNGIHSVSVVLSKNMKDLQKHRIWKVNEFFHHKFSHMLFTVSAVLMMASYVILEMNHPSPSPLTGSELIIIIISGIITGIILGFLCIEGSIPKEMFAIIYALVLLISFSFIKLRLDFRHYPYSSFIEVMFVSSIMMMSLYKYRKKGYPEIVPQYFFD